MKAIVKSKPEQGFELMDVATPVLKNSGDVKLKILKSSVCGTDYHIYKWDQWASETINCPQINGHEVIAQVVELGSEVTNFAIGDVVVCETHLHCNTCYQCRTGNAHICEEMQILGVNRDGIWCEFQVVPQNVLWKVNELDQKYAAIMEPLGNAIHTISYSDVRAKHVLIIGAGPIGLLGAYAAIISGAATVTISEINDYRIKMVHDMDVNINVINPASDNFKEKLSAITCGHMADVVLEMSGNARGLLSACEAVVPGGDINILSVYPSKMVELPLNDLVFKNVKCQFVTGRKLFETWNTATNWLNYKIMDPKVLDVIITHEFKMDEFEKVFAVMEEKMCGKIVLDFTYLDEEK